MTTQTTYYLGHLELTIPAANTGEVPTIWDGLVVRYKTRAEAAKILLRFREVGKGELKIIRCKEIIVDADSVFDRENESRIRQEIY